MYVAGRNNTVQRVEWTSDTVCTATVTAGTPNSNSNRDETAGSLDAEDIRITDSVSALNIVGDRIIFSHSGHVDELTESLFTATNKDDAWQIAYGGTLDSRMDGAKKAIIAIIAFLAPSILESSVPPYAICQASSLLVAVKRLSVNSST